MCEGLLLKVASNHKQALFDKNWWDISLAGGFLGLQPAICSRIADGSATALGLAAPGAVPAAVPQD